MPSDYQCPSCQSEEIIDHGDFIECSRCGGEFYKEFLNSNMDKENISPIQDLHGFIDSFEEFKDEKKRKEFLNSLNDEE
ncbi:MAG: hypothetical protein ACFE9Q_11190 [Candidatus Hodarchaeota archaeon]